MTDPTPTRDWLVTFARKVAAERAYSASHPGHVYMVMLRRDEAEGLLAAIMAEVPSCRLEPISARTSASHSSPEKDAGGAGR